MVIIWLSKPDRALHQVFVDEVTCYAFIKTPCGGDFVRQIEHDKIAEAMKMAKRTPLLAQEADTIASR
jgi:hypothetical protein